MLKGYHLLLRNIPRKYIERPVDIPRENLYVGPFHDMGSIKIPVKLQYVYPERVDMGRHEVTKKTAIHKLDKEKPYLGPYFPL